jgi:Bacterial flagellin C-terminal helical region
VKPRRETWWIRSARPLTGKAEGEDIVWSFTKVDVRTMAKEMMEFTKNNILSQAAQAMLAQSNQMPQGVLQLLR